MNRSTRAFSVICFIVAVSSILCSCDGSGGGPDSGLGSGTGENGEPAGNSPKVPVRVAVAKTQPVQVELYSVGRVVSQNTPTLASEIDARVTEVLVEEGQAVGKGQILVRLDTTATRLARREAQAEIDRLNANIDNEKRRVARYRDLKSKGVMPQERLDDTEAQLAVYQASLVAAEARLAIAADRLTKAELRSPVDGQVETRHVSVGDFAKFGSPLVTVTDTQALRALLPFPETVSDQIRQGQTMFLESVVDPGHEVEVTISQIRPEVGQMNRSLIVISDLQNPGTWRPEATVEARLVVERRPDAIVVPAISVVSRPAGKVVYLIESGRARQQPVQTGERRDNWIEIRTGLRAGDRIAKEGAYYLTDGVAVIEQESGK